MLWTDVYDIAMDLVDTHEGVDPVRVRFTDLRQWVLELPEFKGTPEGCNEKILEAIQQAWIDELE